MGIELLDYDKAEIRMHVTSQIEKEKRITACAKEVETVEWIESLPYQSVLVDAGANVGSYSLIAASLGHWVLAYEASPTNFARLIENVELNGLQERIFACPHPLWWRKERIYLKLSSSQVGAAEHHIHTGAGEDAYPLDETLTDLPVPTHMKLDVDGPELEVLLGAQKTLEGIKQLQVEIDDRLPSSLLIPEWLAARGFRIEKETRHGDTAISNILFGR